MSETYVVDPENGVDLKSQSVQAAEELRSAAASRASQFGEAVERKTGQVTEGASERADQLRQAAETGWEEAKVKVTHVHIQDGIHGALHTAGGYINLKSGMRVFESVREFLRENV